ncbi:MAG TPA: 4-hydroxy-tetrahydrodipicolinate reductase [Rhodanobacteraceae bacterium]|nr:4-hydroxy-tetrahydrodipicolinate reductase [Rhodanobacteraceae bacterium]
MSKPTRIVVHGASGRMGGALLELLRNDARFALVAALVPPGSPVDGKPVPAHEGLEYLSGWSAIRALDVIIDFTSGTGALAALDQALVRGVPLVSGSTGLNAAARERFAAASRELAIVHADNFSLGVAVLTRLLGEAAAALPEWDLEIVEAHHAGKRDAPSGTALALGRAASEARGMDFHSVAATDRVGQRRAGDIGFASLRGGDIAGEHTALLCGAGERLELSHRATDRRIFARGALAAAAWVAGCAPGLYGVGDVVAGTGTRDPGPGTG